MIKKQALLFVLLAAIYSLSFPADPFYTNLLSEGKQQFLAGRNDEALESFQLAEFGLLDEKEYVAELYFFFALAQYKKGAVGESQALLDKMKAALGEEEYGKAKKPAEIERDLSVMTRVLAYLAEPGSGTGSLPFISLFYETWDLLRDKQIPAAEANIKRLGKLGGDRNRLLFLEGFIAFQKGDFKRCLSRLEKISGPLPAEYGEDASFCLAVSYLQRGDLAAGEKWAQQIKDPEHVHQLMELLEQVKAGAREKRKK